MTCKAYRKIFKLSWSTEKMVIDPFDSMQGTCMVWLTSHIEPECMTHILPESLISNLLVYRSTMNWQRKEITWALVLLLAWFGQHSQILVISIGLRKSKRKPEFNFFNPFYGVTLMFFGVGLFLFLEASIKYSVHCSLPWWHQG